MIISKQELLDMRERAIAEQQKANDPAKDMDWLRAQQKSIAKMMQRKAKCPMGNAILVDYEEAAPQRRRDLLEKWLDDMDFVYKVDKHELSIWLDLPELNKEASPAEARRASEPTRVNSHSHSALPSRPSSFDSAKEGAQLSLLTSASSKLSNSPAMLPAPKEEASAKWTATDQKWVESTQRKVMHQFWESGKNTARNWCSVVITDTTEERNRRLLAWLKGLGLDCNLTSSVLHDEYFHIICTMNARFYCILDELFK